MSNYNDVNEIDEQISVLESKKQQVKDNIKEQAKKEGWFSLIRTEFESSSERTPEYISFHRLFKKQFTELLKEEFNIDKILIGKPNHFDVSGFFSLKSGKIFYFSISDLRGGVDLYTFLIRKAEHFKDYSGGSNQFANVRDDYDHFLLDLRSIVDDEKYNSFPISEAVKN